MIGTVKTDHENTVQFKVLKNDNEANVVITGYEVIRFGVPIIGEYVNTGTVSISPAVTGAQYRITAWALIAKFNGRRSATPAVEYFTPGKAS